MWAKVKSEFFYGRFDPERMSIAELKPLIWRCFMSYMVLTQLQLMFQGRQTA